MHAHPDDHLDVLLVGAGQAGLATAAHLARRGVRSLVVDAAPELGHSWRSRWDSLRLFSPAEYDGLPFVPFPAPAGTYPTKDEVADYLAAYVERLDLPVRLGCRVERLTREGDCFVAHTSQGPLHAREVVVATGPFQTPVVPEVAGGLAPEVHQLHSAAYRSPERLAAGSVLVVGGGNSGLQIAEELATAGRAVTLSVGTTPARLPQRILGRDLFWWLSVTGAISKPADSRLARRMRARGELVIGTSTERVARAGVELRPRLTGADGTRVTFADGTSVEPATVVWATGFRRDYSWVDVPGVVVDGDVVHERGETTVPGLSFVGLPWQHSRGSALLGFVQHDAAWLAARIDARLTARPARVPGPVGSGARP